MMLRPPAMKVGFLALIATLGATTALSACADGGASIPSADVSHTVYYDGYYGPFYGGYWGSAGDFRYFDLCAMRYRRDRLHHFRQDPAEGFKSVQAQERPEHRQSPNRRGH